MILTLGLLLISAAALIATLLYQLKDKGICVSTFLFFVTYSSNHIFSQLHVPTK